MKKSRLGLIGMAMMMAATAATPAAMANANQTTQNVTEQSNSKATKPESKKHNSKTVKRVGGLDLVHEFTRQSNPPYQYAIINGAKKHGKKTNYNKISHNYKVKRRAK